MVGAAVAAAVAAVVFFEDDGDVGGESCSTEARKSSTVVNETTGFVCRGSRFCRTALKEGKHSTKICLDWGSRFCRTALKA